MTAVLMMAALVASGTTVESTSYCLSGRMADGTYVRAGSAANNWLPLGTRIWVDPAVHGRHRWTVRDRIGYGTQLDLWHPSCAVARAYGRRRVRMSVGWHTRPLMTRHRLIVRHPPTVPDWLSFTVRFGRAR